MSAFIPMVSTMPPPIDDDDFGDFIDSTHQEGDEFGDFSSAVSQEDCFDPSLNMPLDITNSTTCSSVGKNSPTKISMQFKSNHVKENNKEVETMTKLEEVDRKDDLNNFGELGATKSNTQSARTESPTGSDEHFDSTCLENESDFADFSSAKADNSEMARQDIGMTTPSKMNNLQSSESIYLKEAETYRADIADFQVASSKTMNEDAIGDEFSDFNSVTKSSSDILPEKNLSRGSKACVTGDFQCDFSVLDSSTKSSTEEFSNASPWNMDHHYNLPRDYIARDDDFGDFTSGSATERPATTVTKTSNLGDKVANYLSKYSIVNDGGESLPDGILCLNEHLNVDGNFSSNRNTSPMTSVESLGIVRSGDLWQQLEDIDNAIALKFLWNGSGHNKHLLASLGMHTRNILFSEVRQASYWPPCYAVGLV